jgi:leader peptidase (prepilin peptidase)/N-methyltransferase
LCIIWAFVGACLASFTCVCAERVPARRTLNGRSTCVCGRQLRALENIPVMSWVALRGRSSCCGVRIPVFYVLAEALSALCFALAVVLPTVVMGAVDVAAVGVVLVVGLRRYARRDH